MIIKGSVLQNPASADATWVGRMSVSPRLQRLAGVLMVQLMVVTTHMHTDPDKEVFITGQL